MSAVRATVAALAVASAVISAAGCTSGAGHEDQPSLGASASATRWWSNSAAAAGSMIDAGAPDAAAAELRPSRDDYCGMLEQAVRQGASLTPKISASDPTLITTMTAFFTELQKVAPPEVASDWQVIGKATLALVQAGGRAPKKAVVDAASIQAAADRVGVDAKRNCGVDLTAAGGS